MSVTDPVHADSDLDRVRAVEDVTRYADDPSAVLALNSGTQHFRTPVAPGFIAYRPAGRWLVQIGGAHAAAEHRTTLITQFRRFAVERSGRVLAVQLQLRDAVDHQRCGYTVNQLGASYALDLSTFSLRGRHFMQLRNKISRARRAGVTVQTTTFEALDDADRGALYALDTGWLRAKGRFTKPLKFMVGELGGPAAPLRQLVVGRIDGRIVGYLSLSPVFGTRPGWLLDLSRRSHDAPPGVMELLTLTSMEGCQAAGAPWWHLGFTPFTGLDPAVELPGASRSVRRLVHLFADHGNRLYPAVSQVDYKHKWGELTVLPDYLAFDGRPALAGVVRLMQVANLI